MSDTSSDISITRGDSFHRLYSILSGTNPIDITGWTIRFTVRTVKPTTADVSDADALIAKVITTFANPTLGQFQIDLLSSETNIEPGRYLFDIQATHASEKTTYYKGALTITYDITRS